ncbi:MAG TPA: peptidylprolyl isomerase [Myxococcaceae bacterium]|nr:peptidylprolyl isomerase [Myxococcaceae bacterium]
MSRPALVLALSLAAGLARPARAELVDRVAAVVNNEIITLSAVQKRAAFEFQKLDAEVTPQDRQKKREEITRKTLDAIIDEYVLDQELKEAKIVIDDKQVEMSVQEVMKRYNFNSEQLSQAVANEGLTMADYREQMRKQLARYQLLREKVQKKIKVSEADIRSEYDRMARTEGKEIEIHVRHIVVQLPQNPTPAEVQAAELKAKAIAAEARQPGVDFAELAKRKSEGSSAADGGDLGFFKHGAMVPAFEAVAFSLKPGEVSDPVQTSLGWHVLKLEEERAVGLPPLSEMKAQIEDKLRQEQVVRASAQYVQQLRQAAVLDNKLFPAASSQAKKLE